MPLVVQVYDGVNLRAREPVIRLRLVSERVTARELIERRVRQEVEEFKASKDEVFRGLVQPTAAEVALNGFKVPRQVQVDADAQVASALRAFESNGFLLLIDDRQVESLDDVITLHESSGIAFIKLVPLVGG
jgi:hypothetical protein